MSMTSPLTPVPRSGVRGLSRLLAALISVVVIAVSAMAADPSVKAFDLPAQNANVSLKRYSEQAGVEVIFSSQVAKDVRTNAVMGNFTAQEALDQMLADTGLVVVRESKTGAISVRKETSIETKNVSRVIAEKSGRPDRSGRIELDEKGEPVVKLDTFEVFGRKSLNMDIRRTENDAQPYVVFDRSRIENSGAQNLEDFLRNQLSASTTLSSPSQLADASGNRSQISLRGLSDRETLILVDGRRMAGLTFGSSSLQPDINGLPISAIERIEVLPATASGIYGGGATGGVINIVLRKDYRASEVALNYSNTFDSDAATKRLGFHVGVSSESGRTRFAVSGAKSTANTLLAQDREYTSAARSQILATNPTALLGSAVPPLGGTTNIRASAAGTNLSLLSTGMSLNSPVTYVPFGYAGIQSDNGNGLVANAGQLNLSLANTAQSDGALRGLVQTPDTASVMMTLSKQLSERMELYVDGWYTENHSYVILNNSSGSFSIPVGAAANPFAQAINVTTPAYGLDQDAEATITSTRASLGLIFKVTPTWKGTWDYTWQKTGYTNTTPGQTNNAALTNAIRTGQINIFRDGAIFGDSFRQYLLTPSKTSTTSTTLNDISLRVGGPVSIGGVERVAISTLAEYRSEKAGEFSRPIETAPGVFSTSYVPSRSQTVTSVYAEALLPIVTSQNPRFGVQLLELQLAGRIDQYETESVNTLSIINGALSGPIIRQAIANTSAHPTMSIRIKPASSLIVRASFGTGFLPPTADQLLPASSTSVSNAFLNSIFQLRDPLRGNEVLGDFSTTGGGNPALMPEWSQSLSAGLILELERYSGFRLSADWTKIKKRDAIQNFSLISPSDVATILQFIPARVVRAAPTAGDSFGVGKVTAIDASAINVAAASVEAFDLALGYHFKLGANDNLSIDGKGTYLRSIQTVPVTGAPASERAGIQGNVKWRSNLTIEWEHGRWTFGTTGHYYAPYWQNQANAAIQNQLVARVPRQYYQDVYCNIRFNDVRRPSLRVFAETILQLGIRNVFDTPSPLDLGSLLGGRYYSPLGDPRGASYYVNLKKGF